MVARHGGLSSTFPEGSRRGATRAPLLFKDGGLVNGAPGAPPLKSRGSDADQRGLRVLLLTLVARMIAGFLGVAASDIIADTS